MRGLGLGEVVASNRPDYRVGQIVQGLVGWQQYAVASPAAPLMPVEVAEGVSPSAYLGVLGMTGLTAWVGIPTSASRSRGRRSWSRRRPDRSPAARQNVGGDIMDAIFARINIGARVALCGLISGYNSADPPPWPHAFGNLLIQRATLQGFIVLDHFGRAQEEITDIAGLIAEGKLTRLETVIEGFEQLPTAVNMLFDGKNVGKLVVNVSG